MSRHTLAREATQGNQQVFETGQAQKANTGRNAAIGASAFIPVIGPAIAATGAAVAANQDRKAAASGGSARPERRRATRARDRAKDRKAKTKRALETLSQAVFQYASAVR